ncbi:DUF4010 domain-containing protein [Sphingomonas sp. MAH-20]|uniref:DUF4010 domain-containing protein n=2 Tax=Sphingomonadaceae TaxID=41297 RepID=A0A6I4IYG5_9SPHN|nr:DUF4010 domain-containing protein [Sphingomonas horti]MBA2918313.1 DUF4010 domain-containing protein [Sphingomonas sp. CGMCC 1.13658]MVO77280.1 DUF4010 domain-containing protein [Sphingomonas horti]
MVIGLLIGVERAWQSRGEQPGTRVAGIRTFGLVALTGAAGGLLLDARQTVAGNVIVAVAAVAIGIGYWRTSREHDQRSATSAIAALLTLALGILAACGFAVEAVASACIATVLLASREQLHGWISGLSEADVQATVRFALIVAAVWPLLPDRAFGPYDAWNLRYLWSVVVLVAGFSFAGYVANKRFGQGGGTFATAALGGLYSSTAVIASLSIKLRGQNPAHRVITVGIAIASTVMFARVLVLAAILAPAALPGFAATIGPAGIVAAAYAGWLIRKASADREEAASEADGRNPIELLPALFFAALVAATAVATRWAEQRFGGMGVGAVIVISGSFDVDAATVTLGGLPPGTLSPHVAGLVLAGPVLINTLFKAIVVLVNGGRHRWSAAMPLLAAATAVALAITAGAIAGG